MRNVPIIHVQIVPSGTHGVPPVDVSSRVLSLQYEDLDSKADKVSLRVDNQDLRNFDEPIWRSGSVMILRWGYPDAMSVQRLMRIRRVSGFKQLTVEGQGGELALDRLQFERIFENMTNSEIVTQIAREWGFREDRVLHVQDTDIKYAHISQGKWTDAQFVRLLAKRERFVWYIDHSGFHWHSQYIEQRSIKTYYYYADNSITEILDIAIDVDVTRVPGTVVAKTYEPRYRENIRIDATEMPDSAKQSLAEMREVIREDDWVIPGLEDSAHKTTIRVVADTRAKVIRSAQSALADAQKQAVTLKMSVLGDPNIYAKTVIEILGIGKRLSQKYYIKGVTHAIGAGYVCELDCISDGTNGHSTKSEFLPEAMIIQMMPRNDGPSKKGDGKDPGKEEPATRVSAESMKAARAAMLAAREAKYASRKDPTRRSVEDLEADYREEMKFYDAEQKAIHDQEVNDRLDALKTQHEAELKALGLPATGVPAQPVEEKDPDKRLKAIDDKYKSDQKKIWGDAADKAKAGNFEKTDAGTKVEPTVFAPEDEFVGSGIVKPAPQEPLSAELAAVREGNIPEDQKLYVQNSDGEMTRRQYYTFRLPDDTWVVIPTTTSSGEVLTRQEAVNDFDKGAHENYGRYLSQEDATQVIKELQDKQSSTLPPAPVDRYEEPPPNE